MLKAIVEIAQNNSIIYRVAAQAALEGEEQPVAWATTNIWKIAAQPGWAEDWQYARDQETPNVNPDTGARSDVISDAKILAAVQAVRSSEAP